MLACYSLVDCFTLQLIFIFISALIIKCEELNHLIDIKDKNYCPFIETLSFGSDIHIKCNNTYLIFNEINNDGLSWKFANQSSFCKHKGKHHAFVNQCNITRIDTKYLKVPVMSSEHYEHACIYCSINYKSIAPTIIVTQSNDGYHTLYTFNLTANGLVDDESFEILWAKRSSLIRNSLNYWFLQGCIDPIVEIIEDTGHTIIFLVDDVAIDRVEFIIRRCNGTCRSYRTCDNEEIFDEISSNNFHTPDSIEKISCDYDCLNGLVSTTSINNIINDDDILLSTIQLTNEKQTIKFFVLFPVLGLLIVLIFLIIGFVIIYRIRSLRTENVYTKTSQINMDEIK